MTGRSLTTAIDYMRRYRRLTAHIIAASLGYYTPSRAAVLIRDAKYRKDNQSEWVYMCFQGNSSEAVRRAIQTRHYHKGRISNYQFARELVERAISTRKEPFGESWSVKSYDSVTSPVAALTDESLAL
jgi:hypothetical protein